METDNFRRYDYTIVWCKGKDVSQTLNKLRDEVNKHTRENYKLLGGVSLAFNDRFVYATQTLTREY